MRLLCACAGMRVQVCVSVREFKSLEIQERERQVATVIRALHREKSVRVRGETIQGRDIDKVVNYRNPDGQVELDPVESPDECRAVIKEQLTNRDRIADIARDGHYVQFARHGRPWNLYNSENWAFVMPLV